MALPIPSFLSLAVLQNRRSPGNRAREELQKSCRTLCFLSNTSAKRRAAPYLSVLIGGGVRSTSTSSLHQPQPCRVPLSAVRILISYCLKVALQRIDTGSNCHAHGEIAEGVLPGPRNRGCASILPGLRRQRDSDGVLRSGGRR